MVLKMFKQVTVTQRKKKKAMVKFNPIHQII